MREIQFLHDQGDLPPSLEKVHFLRSLDKEVIDKVMDAAVMLECDPGDSLIIEGDATDFFCILLTGEMDIMKDGQRVSRLSGSGEMIGELALVTNRERAASVVAASHAYCLKIDPSSMEKLDLAERNGFYAALYRFTSKLLADRLTEASKKIAKLESKVRELSGLSAEADPDDGQPPVYRL